MSALDENNISSKVYWDTPVHQTKYYKQTLTHIPTLPNADDIANRVLSLPMYPDLSTEQATAVADAVIQVIENR